MLPVNRPGIAPLQRVKQLVKRLLGRSPPPASPQSAARYALWSIGLFTGTSPLALDPGDTVVNPIVTRDLRLRTIRAPHVGLIASHLDQLAALLRSCREPDGSRAHNDSA